MDIRLSQYMSYIQGYIPRNSLIRCISITIYVVFIHLIAVLMIPQNHSHTHSLRTNARRPLLIMLREPVKGFSQIVPGARTASKNYYLSHMILVIVRAPGLICESPFKSIKLNQPRNNQPIMNIRVIYNADSYSHVEEQSSVNNEWISDFHQVNQPWPSRISSRTWVRRCNIICI